MTSHEADKVRQLCVAYSRLMDDVAGHDAGVCSALSVASWAKIVRSDQRELGVCVIEETRLGELIAQHEAAAHGQEATV